MKANINYIVWYCMGLMLIVNMTSCSNISDSSDEQKQGESYSWLIGDWVADSETTDMLKAFLFLTDEYASKTEGYSSMSYDDYECIKHRLGRCRYTIINDSLVLKTYKFVKEKGWVDNFTYFRIDSVAKVLKAPVFEGDSLHTYRKVEQSEIETWHNKREEEMSREYTDLEVKWDNEFHWDDGYFSYAYGLEKGMWRYNTEDEILVFNFMKGFSEDSSVSVIKFDAEGNQISKQDGKWEPGDEQNGEDNKEYAKITLDNGETISLEYDRENYDMIYDGQSLTYLIQGEDNQVNPNKEISKERATLFFKQFYDKFLNLRKDGSFTFDILIEENGTYTGVKPEFINLLSNNNKENFDSYPEDVNRGPIYEMDFVGLWGAKDWLLSKTPKDVIYLGNKSKYNYKVVMDYKDQPHEVLFRLIEIDNELLIDEAMEGF